MTREDYINMCMEKAKQEAIDVLNNHLKPFKNVVDGMIIGCETDDEYSKTLKDMGYNMCINCGYCRPHCCDYVCYDYSQSLEGYITSPFKQACGHFKEKEQ